MLVTPFCIPGGHPAQAPTGTLQEGATLPSGWQSIRASKDKQSGLWMSNPNSPAKILVCPEHEYLIG